MNKPLLEIFKELGRWAVLGIISWLLTEGIVNTLLRLIFKDTLDPQVTLIVVTAVTAVLRKIDEQLHDLPSFKPYGKKNDANGLLPF